MEDFEDKLNKHIDKVLELQRNKETKPLSLQELKEVDMSLGMTEEEWLALMQKADDNVKLAQSHMAYNNYIEAYKAADLAVSINPYHEEALLVLSQAALGKYEGDEKDEFLETAQKHANELLKINPNKQQAVEIISKVRKYQSSESVEKKNYIRYGAIGLFVVMVIAAIVIFRPKSEPKENTQLKFQLIEAEENANAAWAQVENVIARRDQMLPQLFSLLSSANSESANLKNEIETLNTKLGKTNNADEKIGLQSQLQEKLKSLITIVNSNNPDEKTKLVLVQIEGSYNRVSVEGMRYNDLAKEYNILVKKYGNDFPDFKEKAYFKGK